MKIGLVTPYIYPLPGGVNAHVGFLHQHLRARGHEVRIISSTHGLQRSSEGDIIRLGRGFSVPTNGSVGTLTVSPRFLSQVRDVLDRERFDLLHFHEPFVPFLSLVLLRESTSVNVATFHAYSGWSPAYEFGQRMLAGYARRLHGRIAVSGAARHFIDRYFPGDYKVIPNGVEIERFAGARPVERWRDGTPNVLFVGRFEERKGLLHLLKAYRLLRREGHDSRLLVVGGGPQEREVRRYIYTRGLTGVELLGRVSEDDKARYFATADVYVSPATGRESFGIVLLEAMAAGAPIVCSDIHGYKGVVRRGEQALLVEPGDQRALAAAIGELLDDPDRRARMSESGRARAREFGWDRVAARVDEYYGFVVRRLSAQGQLPSGYHAPVPPPVRGPVAAVVARAGNGAAGQPANAASPD
jgi:phosphatidylinositol alpha-mannosyltransferase